MSSRDLEREADENRAQLSSTLDELRDRLTPGQIVDELFAGSSANVSAFVRNLGTTFRDNPMPALLVGAGCMLMMTGMPKLSGGSSSFGFGGRSRTRGSDGRYASYGSYEGADDQDDWHDGSDRGGGIGEKVSGVASSVGEMAHSVTDRIGGGMSSARSMASGLADKASSMASELSDTARGGSRSMSDAAHGVYDSAASMGRSASRTTRNMAGQAGGMVETIKDQPVVLAALGLVLGAAVGALFPATDVENRVMGETADHLKGAAGEALGEAVENVKDVAVKTFEDVKDQAKEQGLSVDKLREASGQFGEKLSTVADHAVDAIKEAATDATKRAGGTNAA